MTGNKMYNVLSTISKYSGNGVFSVVSEEVALPNGKIHEHVTVKHKGAVVILPITAEGKIILVEQYRHSVREILLELPAGSLKADEDPAICAARELSEETGFGCKKLTPIGILYPAPGFCDEKQHLFIAQELFPQQLTCDEDEDITVREVSSEALEELIRVGEVRDAKTISLFFKAKLLGVI